MTFASIRTRLSAWYAAVFALLLGAFAFAAYTFLEHTSQARIDQYLAETADAVAGAMEFELAGGMPFDRILTEIKQDFRLRDIAVAVLDRDHDAMEVAQPSEHPRIPPLPGPTALHAPDLRVTLAATRPGDAMTFSTVRGDAGLVRVVALPYRLGTHDVVVGAAQSLSAQQRTLRDARYALGLGIPVMLLVATAGGSLLARKSLEPVASIAERAASISASSLHERLPVRNPRDELGRLATVLNDLLGRLDRSFEEQRRFMTDASHELRTPVAIISGEAELALSRDSRTVEELRDTLARVRDESARLKQIVDNLFLLARAEAGDSILTPTEVYLGEVAADSVRAMRSVAERRGVRLAFSGSEDLPFRGDESLLRRLFVNLLDNAIKYTPAGGEVSLSAVRRDGEYVVSVADTGPGVPAEARAHIFDRFFRADRDRRASTNSGAGLGLAIAAWIAHAHGGALSLEQSDASGSRFSVGFPVPTDAS